MAVWHDHFYKAPDPKPMYLYIARCGTMHKVGVSYNPTKRLLDLQKTNINLVEIVWQTIDTYRREDAFMIENEAKTLLRSRLVKGEWFECSIEKCVDAIIDGECFRARDQFCNIWTSKDRQRAMKIANTGNPDTIDERLAKAGYTYLY